MKKKGLHNILTSVLLVLLALAAIVIIWVFIAPLFSKGDTDVSGFQVGMEIVPGSIVFSEGGINLNVRRNAGGDTVVSGFKVVVYDEQGETVVKEVEEEMEEFEVKKVYVPYYNELGNIVKVSVVPSLLNSQGIEVEGRIADEHSLNAEEEQSSFLRFVQVADTHILVSPVTRSNPDGRTASSNSILTYVPECEDSDQDGFPDDASACPWINETSGASLSTIIALEKAIPIINNYAPNFTIFAGDNVAEKSQKCDPRENHEKAVDLLEQIASGLEGPYYLIAADAHDNWEVDICRQNFVDEFGDFVGDWNFTIGDNLFIGLSEWYAGPGGGDASAFNVTYLDDVLNTYAGTGKKAFVNIHSPLESYDSYLDKCIRCWSNDTVNETIKMYKNDYRAIVVLAGHSHATVRDTKDEAERIYHVTTTSLMNYPTEFRIVDITPNTINFFMSGSVDEGVDYVSKTIMENHLNSSGDLNGWNPMTSYGDEFERDIFIDLR